MQQLLEAHAIPTRILDLGAVSYLGVGSPAALQVPVSEQMTALLLLSPINEDAGSEG